jgi:MATE family multidrug resistance protein
MKFTRYSTKFSKKQIILLSIPVFFSNLAIPLVGIVDTGLMGNLGETKYLAATSIATSVMTMVIWSFGFLRMGTVGIVSQAYGRGDYREIVRTLLRNFVVAMAIALVIIILKPLISISIQHFFNTSAETQKLINTYLNARVFSVPAELAIYILVGFYLGIQKTKISSFIILTLSILNIAFSSVLVLSYNLDVFGVVLGTLLASFITVIIFSLLNQNF